MVTSSEESKYSDKSIEAMSRRASGTFIFYLTLISLFNSCAIDHEECKEEISSLEDRITELENELEDANSKIEEYESKLDQIQSEASDGYQAIQYFNWSYELQEALDAFDNIQNEASY